MESNQIEEIIKQNEVLRKEFSSQRKDIKSIKIIILAMAILFGLLLVAYGAGFIIGSLK
jgi:uncharacterized membrane protein